MWRSNSKSMKVAIPVWLPFCKDIPAEFRLMLVEVSPATIDRLLKPQRGAKPKALSSTRPSLIKNKIPLKLLDREVDYPGFIEADTVAHCGESLSGGFCVT